MSIYRVLEIPFVYRMSQAILAPGHVRIISQHLSRALAQVPAPATVLDVGCGPSSFLWNLGMKPVGLDLCHAYTKKFHDAGNLSVTASAAVLPFPADSFDLVFSMDLLHHLPDEARALHYFPGIHDDLQGLHLPHHEWKRNHHR